MVLPRGAVPTVSFVDEYCSNYKQLFPEVRSFESFKFLHMGIISDIRRKSLPEIAKSVGLKDSQSLNNFLKNSPWDVRTLREQRLDWIKDKLNNRSFILIVNEIGDKKKGKKTDYVTRQYIGDLGKSENSIVSVNAYGVLDGVTFPLTFKVFKPQNSLPEGERYKTKPQLAIEIIQELRDRGFNFELVTADMLYAKNCDFVEYLNRISLKLLIAVKVSQRSLLSSDRPNCDNCQGFERIFANNGNGCPPEGENIYSKLQNLQYRQIDPDITQRSSNITWSVMTNYPEAMLQEFGNINNLINWIELGFKHLKQELGWGDFRLTNYRAIERWWEMIFSAHWMVSLHSDIFKQPPVPSTKPKPPFIQQYSGKKEQDWKIRLSNLRSIVQL
jgi:SRSO17 transposase